MLPMVYLIRHGETEWSKAGRHTGRTDLPLTEHGDAEARALAPLLEGPRFTHVFMSPRQRAQQTCALAGLARAAEVDHDLAEWDYGDFEGLQSVDILRDRPNWNVFREGCLNGESPAEVSARADRVIARIRGIGSDVALFTHGHFGRVLGARWVGLPVAQATRLYLGTASISALGYEHDNLEEPVIRLWNQRVSA